jgi:FkbM family methyltransferase
MLFSRVRDYWRELPVCYKLGAGLSDGLRLVGIVMSFHIANALHFKPRQSQQSFLIALENMRARLTLRSFSGDVFILQEVLGLRCYRMSHLCQENGLIVDLGANIGLAALYCFDRYRPKRIICVEPNPHNIPLLTANLSGIQDKVTIVHGAISSSTGMVSFDSSAETWGGAIKEGGEPVPSYTMSDLVRQYCGAERISLLKVDIEGAERALFQGDLGWLERVDNIIIELHEGVSLEEFERTVSPHGFEVIQGGNEENPLPVAVRRAGVRSSSPSLPGVHKPLGGELRP